MHPGAARPRLLYVVTLAEVGGAQAYVANLLPAALERFDVAVAAHGAGPLEDAATALGVPFIPLRHVRRALSPIHDPLGLLELIALYRRLRPDIVHLNSSKAGILGRLAAVPARVPVRVFTAHGWAFKATSGAGSLLYRAADRAVLPFTSFVVCVSQAELAAGLAAGTCRAEQTVVIPNAVEVATAPQRTRGERQGPVEIVSVGRLADPKDFATLIAAVGLLPEGRTRLTLIGDGPQRHQLEAQIAAGGHAATVELAGEVSDVPARLAHADIFVLSSRSEGMPISVLEAMAAGLPVVASAVGGLPEVVDDGTTGLLVPAGSVGDLAAALQTLVDDPQLRERLGMQGHERADAMFSLERWRTAHLELYRSLLADR